MLHFFSKMRYKLAAENKVAKYLRYAIGEILLVVIGILIALQVNNWNEHRKTKIEEKKFLKQLKIEFTDNQNKLAGIIHHHRTINYSLRKLLAAIKPKPEVIPEDSLTKYLAELPHIRFYKPKKRTITSLISTGKISIISNDSLIVLLGQWSENLEGYQYGMDIIYDLYQYQILPYTVEQLHFRNAMIDVGHGNSGPSSFSYHADKILSDSKLENLVELRRVNEESIELNAIKLEENQAEILELIEKELSKD